MYTWAGERKRKCDYIPGHVLAFKLGVIVVDDSLCFLNYICIKCILVYQILPNARHFEKQRSGHVVQPPAESLQNGDGARRVCGDPQDTLPADGGPAARPRSRSPRRLSACTRPERLIVLKKLDAFIFMSHIPIFKCGQWFQTLKLLWDTPYLLGNILILWNRVCGGEHRFSYPFAKKMPTFISTMSPLRGGRQAGNPSSLHPQSVLFPTCHSARSLRISPVSSEFGACEDGVRAAGTGGWRFDLRFHSAWHLPAAFQTPGPQTPPLLRDTWRSGLPWAKTTDAGRPRSCCTPLGLNAFHRRICIFL